MSQWKFVTNITEYNQRRMTEELGLSSKFERLSWRKAAAFDSTRLSDPQVKLSAYLSKISIQSLCPLFYHYWGGLIVLLAFIPLIESVHHLMVCDRLDFFNQPLPSVYPLWVILPVTIWQASDNLIRTRFLKYYCYLFIFMFHSKHRSTINK